VSAAGAAIGMIPGAVGTVQTTKKVAPMIKGSADAIAPPSPAMQAGSVNLGKSTPKYFNQIPKTSKEIDRLTDFLEKQAEDSGFTVKAGASNVSGSRYVTITKDLPDDEVYSVQVRISNHGDKHPGTLGSADKRFSIDPDTGNTLQDALQFLEDEGFAIRKTIKREKKLTDSQLAKKFGISPVEFQKIQKSRGAEFLPEKLSNKKIGNAFDRMVNETRQDFEEVMFNWQGGVFLNEDANKLITYPGRDQAFSKGKEGGKVVVTKKDMINWLMSDGPFDEAEYGADIKSNQQWVDQIERLRSIVREAK